MNDKGMVLAAARLARTAPQQWDEFVSAFQEYTDDKIVDVIQAPPDMLSTTQGRAQGLTSLGRLLMECRKMAENIDKAAANKLPK
jgi:hypothetical protein